MAHSREPVSDHDNGPPLHQFSQRLLDLLLGLGIDRGGSLVEYQDGGVFEDRSRYGEPLLLSAGELDPPFTHASIVPPRQRLDEGVRVGRLGRRDDLLV